jgi:arylsulfatase A-like enzyme
MIIILYVLDSLRADFLSCYGYRKKTSPNIEMITRDGVIFEKCFSQSTWTRPAGASILTSAYPSVHGVMEIDDSLKFTPILPGALKEKRFTNIAISAMGNISPSFGFENGFDHFIELYKESRVINRRGFFRNFGAWKAHFKSHSVSIATSEDINDFLFQTLDYNSNRDIFILLWSIDTHNPYFHRDSEMVRFCQEIKPMFWDKNLYSIYSTIFNKAMILRQKRLLYEDMIYYNDHYLGLLMEKLRELNLYDQTLLIITSDHGEGFGEHGQVAHAGMPYDEQIRVPLIMKFPHSEFKGRIDTLVQHIDIAPTIIDYMDLKTNYAMQGKSLMDLLSGKKKRLNNFVFTESKLNRNSPEYKAIRDDKYKYIRVSNPDFKYVRSLKDFRNMITRGGIGTRKNTEHLFCLVKDTDEKYNLTYQSSDKIRYFRKVLGNFSGENRSFSLPHAVESQNYKKEDDELVKAHLMDLGYID